MDLSGTLHGAGGIGGLLMMVDNSNGDTPNFYAYDGNGNVTTLVDGADGTWRARYEYGAFGEPIRSSGPLAEENPFRFSTKYIDNASGLAYYGYRYYNPQTGRWLSRDPIGERGGINLYGFIRNNGVSGVDILGLATPLPGIPGNPWPPKGPGPRPIDYYFGGSGDPFDFNEHGLLNSLKELFAPEIEMWRREVHFTAMREAKLLARKCATANGGILRERIFERGRRITPDVTWRSPLGFVFGDTTFLQGYDIEIEVICCYCNFNYSGDLFFSVRDWFRHPIDLPLEIWPGVPYRLTADWSEPIEGGGHVLNCR